MQGSGHRVQVDRGFEEHLILGQAVALLLHEVGVVRSVGVPRHAVLLQQPVQHKELEQKRRAAQGFVILQPSIGAVPNTICFSTVRDVSPKT